MIEKIKSITRGQLILAILVLVIILSIYIFIKVANDNNTQKYKSYEESLINDAKNYYNIKKPKIKKGGEIKITIKKLNDEHLLSTNEILENGCKGYIIIYNSVDSYDGSTFIEYASAIKCGNKYTSSIYQE